MTTQAPNFSPKGGVGTVWKDPSGKDWKYTPTGWVESGSEAIVADNKSKDTFVVKPEEQGIVNTLKTGGAKEADIASALKKRQEILAVKQKDAGSTAGQGLEPVVTDAAPPSTIGKKKFDPFKGKSRTDVMRDAFNNGVTSSKELEELGKTYDLLSVNQTDQTAQMDMSQMTPEQQKIIKEDTKKQIATKGMALATGLERTGVVGTIGTLEAGQNIIDSLEKVDTGFVTGAVRKGVTVFGNQVIPGTRALGKTTAEEDKLGALITLYTSKFMQAISGAAVAEPEVQRLMGTLPSENKTAQANIEGIKVISKFLSDTYGPMVGVDFSPLMPSKNDNVDPLKVLNSGANSSSNPLGI